MGVLPIGIVITAAHALFVVAHAVCIVRWR
jgi:hypothetical protein